MDTEFDIVNVRYIVKDVNKAIEFYSKYLEFKLVTDASPAFAAMTRGNLRLLLSGRTSSGGKEMPDGIVPVPGGWNRFQFVVADIAAEVDKLKKQGLHFRNDIITGPGGSQILLMDPSENFIELFQPADQK